MNRPERILWLLILTAMLTACATGPGTSLPVRAQQGIAENNRGARELARGNYHQALEHFHQALSVAESLEDEDAIATNLINIATAQRRLGRQGEAKAALDRVLFQSKLSFSSDLLAEAAAQRALLALEMGRYDEARKFAAISEQRCQTRCPQHGKLLTLRAYLALATGEAAVAETAALAAVRYQREHNAEDELANGLRILGLALLANGKAGKASEVLDEALTLDKRQASPEAIVNDLIALGRAQEALGNADRAAQYFKRAQAAAIADGNQAGAMRAMKELQHHASASSKIPRP